MGDVEVTGQEQFQALAKRINAQGSAGRGLWRELNKAINNAVEPMTDAVLAHLDHYLPSRYARVLAGTLKVRASRSTKTGAVALKLVGAAKGRRQKRRVGVLNAGTLRHPVYTTNVWVDQKVKPGFWSEPLDQAREIPAKEIRRAVQKTARKIS
jgi:hypothetical protein